MEPTRQQRREQRKRKEKNRMPVKGLRYVRTVLKTIAEKGARA